jgi:DnaJ-class molecular chaperone
MAKQCEYCHGKGTYIVKETFSDGDEILTAMTCNHCHGTGKTPEPQDGKGDFDIAGSSMLEDDDDEDDA